MESRERFEMHSISDAVEDAETTSLSTDRIALLRQMDQDIGLITTVIKRLVAAYPNDNLRSHYAATICRELASMDWQRS